MEYQLLIKKIYGRATPTEEAEFEQWYQESEDHRKYYHRLEKQTIGNQKPKQTDWLKAWKSFDSRNRKQTLFRRIRPWQAIAASILLFAWLVHSFNDKAFTTNANSDIAYVNVPDLDQAILTTESGQRFTLSEGSSFSNKRAKLAGITLAYSQKKGKGFNTLEVPKGNRFNLTLPDGTEVNLNASSKIKYPVEFNGDKREVQLLYGEAYFDVSPNHLNQGKAFIVTTMSQSVRVLGTEFNIRSYPEEEEIKTTLTEGRITWRNGNDLRNLVPNEQIQYSTNNNTFRINKDIDLSEVLAWKDDVLLYKNKPLTSITRDLERWHNVKFVFKDASKKDIRFTGRFKRDKNMTAILSVLEKTNEVRFRIKGQEVIVE
ncbi:iron dicitrate transporter FecR (plasmid) [Fulvitalea axinellae]|uniref:Iron dicitrate transporter FecR n=1 Tax=Fulvitalea axinellae TaxID=1182444 RepID=A0AAU9D6S0_9BACT|nr:iron dicitrate transporter FecR [Fulvitalea axinellae]